MYSVHSPLLATVQPSFSSLNPIACCLWAVPPALHSYLKGTVLSFRSQLDYHLLREAFLAYSLTSKLDSPVFLHRIFFFYHCGLEHNLYLF